MRSEEQLREHYEIERRLSDRLREAPTRDERRRLYGEVYRQRSELIPHHPLVVRSSDAAAQSQAAAQHVRLLRRFAGPESRFCEIGAGDGSVARALAPFVRSALALDVTDALALPDDPADGFEFQVFDGFRLPVPAGSLDLVYSNDVVEHLHPEDMLDQTKAVAEALRPGGKYVCVTPNGLSGPHDISKHFSDRPTGFHLREYTVTELGSRFVEAGFSRVGFLITVGGRRLSPLLPVAAIAPLESAFGRLAQSRRQRFGRGLAAIKVVATR